MNQQVAEKKKRTKKQNGWENSSNSHALQQLHAQQHQAILAYQQLSEFLNQAKGPCSRLAAAKQPGLRKPIELLELL